MSAVVLHSGGIDSTVLLYHLMAEGEEVMALSVLYGQSHHREVAAAREICFGLDVPHSVTMLDPDFFRGSELTAGRGPVVSGVIVPNRNMVLIALAGALAERAGFEAVAVACHAGDHGLFPDCRGTFLEEMFRAMRKGTDHRVGLRYPFVHKTKLEVVRLGMELGVPFEATWSCYRGGTEPCGECLACRERREALFLAGAVPA